MSASIWTDVKLQRFAALHMLLLLVLTATSPAALAQTTTANGEINLLLPADTASPRDTLRSFLMLSEEVIRELRASGIPTERVFLRIRGLQETLDFSSTAFGSATVEQVRRIFMLREILDRVALPPLEEIPGKQEVAAGDIAVWTIPGTRLRIAREEVGLQAGEYLFSATTVDQLDLYYRRIRDLPYQPGAVSQGILDEWQAVGRAPIIEEELIRRLRGIDGASPRATLEHFMASVNEAYRVSTEAEEDFRASPPRISREEARQAHIWAYNLLRRAGSALDLSSVPRVQRADVAIEASLMIKEVLDRLLLPPIDSVPDVAAVRAAGVGDGPYRWELPGTDIEIVRILEGDQAGEFLFSARTLQRIHRIYESLEDLPRRDQGAIGFYREYQSPETSPGFYERYITTPGSLVPSAHFLGRFVQDLPASFQRLHNGQTIWQWIGLGLTVVITAFVVYAVLRGAKLILLPLNNPFGSWLAVLPPVATALLVEAAADFVDADLNFTGDPLLSVRTAARLATLFFYGWAVWKAFSAIAATIVASPRISERGIDASLVRIVCGVFGIVFGIAVVVAGLKDLGIDAVPLLAGLGVGGLAVALAIRPTLENLIGGLILFSDKPVRIGDYCKFGSMNGTVENIGVRSTQIRALDRTLITVPNAKFADMEIVNWAHCDRMLIRTMIGLRYETTPEQMRYLLVKIREMLHAHPMIDRETVRVRYAGPAASSRDVDIRIYALTHDWNEYYAIREDVFLRIDDLVEESGSGYAFPSQTLYMTRDEGLDAERASAATAEVQQWRDSYNLPFPRLRSARMDELEKTLDYPPRGSTESAPPESAEPLSTEPLSTEERKS